MKSIKLLILVFFILFINFIIFAQDTSIQIFIDASGTQKVNDPFNLRLTSSKYFLSFLLNDKNMSIDLYSFDYIIKKLISTNDLTITKLTQLSNLIQNVPNNGPWTDIDKVFITAKENSENINTCKRKYLIVFTDLLDDYQDYNLNNIKDIANNQGLNTFICILGDSINSVAANNIVINPSRQLYYIAEKSSNYFIAKEMFKMYSLIKPFKYDIIYQNDAAKKDKYDLFMFFGEIPLVKYNNRLWEISLGGNDKFWIAQNLDGIEWNNANTFVVGRIPETNEEYLTIYVDPADAPIFLNGKFQGNGYYMGKFVKGQKLIISFGEVPGYFVPEPINLTLDKEKTVRVMYEKKK